MYFEEQYKVDIFTKQNLIKSLKRIRLLDSSISMFKFPKLYQFTVNVIDI